MLIDFALFLISLQKLLKQIALETNNCFLFHSRSEYDQYDHEPFLISLFISKAGFAGEDENRVLLLEGLSTQESWLVWNRRIYMLETVSSTSASILFIYYLYFHPFSEAQAYRGLLT